MLFDRSQALALLQLGDSAYPAGGFAFSWGLEGLAADGMLADRDQLDRIIADHLARRWATMDRILLRQAFHAPNCEAIAAVDRFAEAATPSAEMREGSRRAGRALLGVWVRLGGPLSIAYRDRASSDSRLGHLPIVQAVVYRDAGISARRGGTGLGLDAGHRPRQRRRTAWDHRPYRGAAESARRAPARRAARRDAAADAMPSSFTPLIDIAVSRGPPRHVRMFAT